MPTKEKFYEYVRNATRGKKCYVNQGSRKMLLTVLARFFIFVIVSKASLILRSLKIRSIDRF